MKPEDTYLQKNKQLWNQKVDHHIKSDFYDVENFLKGQTSLNDIELELLGDITDKKILHLQCHFGQDTISLSRRGASVTGVDFSERAIEQARILATKANTDTKFLCSDIYDLPNFLDDKFDIVYTSYGTIGWLPDLEKWATVISKFLKPKGKFVFVEFHPVIWMFDYDFEKINYRYFTSEAIVEKESGTYTDKNADISGESVTWNHGIGEVINSLISKRLEVKSLKEYDYSPYNCFNKTIKISDRKFRIKHLENKIPMVYSIVAEKKSDWNA